MTTIVIVINLRVDDSHIPKFSGKSSSAVAKIQKDEFISQLSLLLSISLPDPILQYINAPKMANPIKDFFAKSCSSPFSTSPPKLPPPCQHSYCKYYSYCVKAHREEALLTLQSQSPNAIREDILEPDNDHSSLIWDSDDGWRVMCNICSHARCPDCEGETFVSVTDFKNMLTFENREIWTCFDCEHGLCPGKRLRLVSLCRVCGHEACSQCMSEGKEKAGPACCSCLRAGAKEQKRRELK